MSCFPEWLNRLGCWDLLIPELWKTVLSVGAREILSKCQFSVILEWKEAGRCSYIQEKTLCT